MSHGIPHKLLLLALGLLSLSACTLGPDFVRPQAPQVEQWSKA